VTADQFLTRVFAASDEMALRLAGTPHDSQEAWLQGFSVRVREQWGQVFDEYISESGLDAIVADLAGRVRAKRDFLERFGTGNS
jgi:hypothetical protein